MELIIIRHGETDANAIGAFSGWTDTALNERGIEQAKKAAKKLKELKITNIDTVYSSPLKRAAQTAEIISNELGCKNIVYSDDLKERNFGDWDGLTIDEIKQLHENEYNLWMKDADYCMKNGEKICSIKKRVKGFLENLIHTSKAAEDAKTKKSVETNYIIVTHLGCIRYMISFLLGMPDEYSWHFRVENGSLARVCINPEGYAYLIM